MVNIAELLKDCPMGTKLYSPLFGEVELRYVDGRMKGIIHTDDKYKNNRTFSRYGHYFSVDNYPDSECLLFPSKEVRTWENWQAPIEPKFKVGDWITDGISKCQIHFIDNTQYWYSEYSILGSIESVNKRYRLWEISDARNGDVLATDNIICIFKKLDKDGYYIISPCIYTVKDGLEVIDDEDDSIGSCGFKPATKEDRELLFRKIKEAGYVWDADKKELKKIKPHYSISNFHAGMPVLVRDSIYTKWLYTLFGMYNETNVVYPFVVVDMRGYAQCIPYNDDTKHLLGTTDMCDERYVNW